MLDAKTIAVGRRCRALRDMALRLGPDFAHDPVPLAVGETRGVVPAFDLPVEAGVGPQMMAVRGHVQPLGIGGRLRENSGLKLKERSSATTIPGRRASRQRRFEVGGARRAAGAHLVADDPLDGEHMLVAPAGERIVDVDQLLGEFVKIEPALASR